MTRSRAIYVTALATIVVAAMLFSSVAVRGQRRPPYVSSGVLVFQDNDFEGRSQLFSYDVPDLRPYGLEKKISSLAFANGEVWQVCDNRNYNGRCETFSGWLPELRSRDWNDRIQSMRRQRGYDPGSPGNPGYPGNPNYPEYPNYGNNGRLELYAGTRYSGQKLVVTGPANDLSKNPWKFNDRAMSVRVPRGQSWEICVNANYDDCRVVDSDVPDLSVLGIGRLVSSARPRYRR